VEPSFAYSQAESSKKNISSKEDLQFNISELSGTIVKQGFLVKQVNMIFEPSLGKKNDSSLCFLENKCDLYEHAWRVVASRANLPASTIVRDHVVKSI